MIGSGTDGLATHQRAVFGPLFGGGGTVGGGYTTGGSNTGGLGTKIVGDGTYKGGLGTDPVPGDGTYEGGLGT